MSASALQQKIDSVTWYHDFDFGGGLVARSAIAEGWGYRQLWRRMHEELDAIDLAGKSVLDIGCWDGYWSFYAERRGARSVLAADDRSQNWSAARGIYLAKELLNSSVEINLDVSAYRLTELRRTFDVIFFFGVYYHLFDPFYALAQIRHCCHPGTLVVIDGPVAVAVPTDAGLFNFANHACEFLPSQYALQQLVRGAYFTEVGHAFLNDVRPGWRWRLRNAWSVLRGGRPRPKQGPEVVGPPPPAHRILMRCVPFEGPNELHAYRPPFGLDAYDHRFRAAAAA